MLVALVVTPFLSNADTNLRSTGTYGALNKESYACDAAVEHAIWNITDGTVGTLLPTIGSTTSYALPNQVNGMTPAITVTRIDAPGGGGKVGTITNTITDSLMFYGGAANTPEIIPVSGTIYAAVYRGATDDGFVTTFSIGADGQIGAAIIDTYAFDTLRVFNPKIIHVSGTVYAVVYGNDKNVGYAKTFQINTNGTIVKSVIDTLNFAAIAKTPRIINISGSVFACVYGGNKDVGIITTFDISSAGVIGNAAIDNMTFDTSNCFEPDIILLAGSNYAIAYRGTGVNGYFATITVAANGAITDTVVQSRVVLNANFYEPNILRVSGTVYAIAFRGAASDGFISTLNITDAGVIGVSFIDTLEFDTTNGYWPSMVALAGGVFAVAYRGDNNDGEMVTVSIATNGDINATLIDSLIYEAGAAYEPSLIQVTGDVFALVYRGPTDHGWVITLQISNSDIKAYNIVARSGGTQITAQIIITTGVVRVVSWNILRV